MKKIKKYTDFVNEELRLDGIGKDAVTWKPLVGDKVVDEDETGIITRLDGKGVAMVDFGDGFEMTYYVHKLGANGRNAWMAESLINELRETDMNAYLDKLGRGEELTPEEQADMDSYGKTGDFDNSPQDKVEFDSEGDLRINDERANPYDISDEFYDEATPTGDRELTPELEKDIRYYLDETYQKGSLRNDMIPKIHKELQYEFGVPLDDIQRIVWDWTH